MVLEMAPRTTHDGRSGRKSAKPAGAAHRKANASPGPAGEAAPEPVLALVVRQKPTSIARPLDHLRELREEGDELIDASAADNTKRAYSADWRTFKTWCDEHEISALPATPDTMIAYFTHLKKTGKKVATIERARTAISQAHETAHVDNPMHASEVKRVMKGIRRTLLVARTKKAPIVADDLVKMLKEADDGTARGCRDAALLALGFAAALRRSELVAIRVEHLRFQKEGLALFLPKSKTDQEGKGTWLGIQHEGTIKLVRAWLIKLEEETIAGPGALFRRISRAGSIGDKGMTPDAVADVVKKYAKKLGKDPALFSGHSLRRGFASQAIRAGKNPREIMKQTRHKSVVVFEGYVEEASIFQNNATKDIW